MKFKAYKKLSWIITSGNYISIDLIEFNNPYVSNIPWSNVFNVGISSSTASASFGLLKQRFLMLDHRGFTGEKIYTLSRMYVQKNIQSSYGSSSSSFDGSPS